MMNDLLHSPVADIICGVVLIIIGALMVVYRNKIGGFTGYYTGRGGYVDKPTPGWMLVPFALALMIGGAVVIFRVI